MDNKKITNIKLNIATRLVLLMNLPEQGSVTDMILKRNIRNKIDFTSQEIEDYQIKNINNKISWLNNAPEISIEFTTSEIEFLKKIVIKLDNSKQITDNILDFVEIILNK